MPCFNGAKLLQRSIDSVFSQSYSHLELIVVNDGSTDNSLAILNSIQDSRLVIINQNNTGVCRARNNALNRAKGEFIAFLDADDTWNTECLSKLYQVFIDAPKTVLAYCGWKNIGLSSRCDKPFVPPDYEKLNKRELLFENCLWPIHATLTYKWAIDEVDRFDESLLTAEDFLLWLKIGTKYPISLVPEVLAFYHFHEGDQASKNITNSVLNHLLAQELFLKNNADFKKSFSKLKIRSMTYGLLLHKAYESYWSRDLKNSQVLFRKVLWNLYFHLHDLRYIIPALLPYKLYQFLILGFSK